MTNENRGDSPENAPSASSGTGLPSRVLRRNRAVAEREASRLARPDRPVGASSLGHASRKKSAVASVPMGLFVRFEIFSTLKYEICVVQGAWVDSWST